MTVGPDVDGFRAAQRRLRDGLGVIATFTIPGTPSWPPGTPLDPETGKPHDPFLEPDTPAVDHEEIATCSFVHRPLRGVNPEDAVDSPIGSVDEGLAALIIDEVDYPRVKDATRVQIGPEIYDIQRFRHDVVIKVDRWIAYLEHA